MIPTTFRPRARRTTPANVQVVIQGTPTSNKGEREVNNSRGSASRRISDGSRQQKKGNKFGARCISWKTNRRRRVDDERRHDQVCQILLEIQPSSSHSFYTACSQLPTASAGLKKSIINIVASIASRCKSWHCSHGFLGCSRQTDTTKRGWKPDQVPFSSADASGQITGHPGRRISRMAFLFYDVQAFVDLEYTISWRKKKKEEGE